MLGSPDKLNGRHGLLNSLFGQIAASRFAFHLEDNECKLFLLCQQRRNLKQLCFFVIPATLGTDLKPLANYYLLSSHYISIEAEAWMESFLFLP